MPCEEGEHQVQLVVLREADNDIRLGDPLLGQEVNVRAVTADRETCRQFFRKQLTAFTISVDYLHLNPLAFKPECKRTSRTSGTDDGGTR